jgi:hypothetical protein
MTPLPTSRDHCSNSVGLEILLDSFGTQKWGAGVTPTPGFCQSVVNGSGPSTPRANFQNLDFTNWIARVYRQARMVTALNENGSAARIERWS